MGFQVTEVQRAPTGAGADSVGRAQRSGADRGPVDAPRGMGGGGIEGPTGVAGALKASLGGGAG